MVALDLVSVRVDWNAVAQTAKLDLVNKFVRDAVQVLSAGL